MSEMNIWWNILFSKQKNNHAQMKEGSDPIIRKRFFEYINDAKDL